MSVSKDTQRGTYYVQCWYKDWQGQRRKKTKRGFKTRKAAAAWEVEFLRQMEGTPDMTLIAFYDLYRADTDKKLRNTTKANKANMIETEILPYLGEKKLSEITPLDILSWQNAIQDERTSNGFEYKESYFNTPFVHDLPFSQMNYNEIALRRSPEGLCKYNVSNGRIAIRMNY